MKGPNFIVSILVLLGVLLASYSKRYEMALVVSLLGVIADTLLDIKSSINGEEDEEDE